jgi:hypothetical protein
MLGQFASGRSLSTGAAVQISLAPAGCAVSPLAVANGGLGATLGLAYNARHLIEMDLHASHCFQLQGL